jgi:hypothetical protein
MVEITLTKEGGFGGYVDFFQSLDSSKEILIEGCCRCIGIIIIWKKEKVFLKNFGHPNTPVVPFTYPPIQEKQKAVGRSFLG